MPTDEEITFVLDIIEQIGRPALQVVENLLTNSSKWDNIARNDFCRSVSPLLKAKPEINFFVDTFMLAGQFGVDCLHSSRNSLKRL